MDTVCSNVSVDLSELSVRFTQHPHLLFFIATAMCLVAAFIVSANSLLIISIVYSRYHGKFVNRRLNQSGISATKRVLFVSFSTVHIIIGGLCMPLAISQVIQNNRWYLGPTFCSIRVFLEAISEFINMYHTICVCTDTFIMVLSPFKYRLLTARTGYGMVMFSWAVPVLLCALSVSLGWHTEGVEDTLRCIHEYNLCTIILSKKFLILIVPVTILTSFVALVAMVFILLKEINRFHQRRSEQVGAKVTDVKRVENLANAKKNQQLGESREGSKRDATKSIEVIERGTNEHEETMTSQKYLGIDISTIANSNITKQYIVDDVDVTKATNGCSSKDKTAPVRSGANRKCKVFGIVIALASLHSVYLILFMVTSYMMVYKTRMFQVWIISAVIGLRYVHSAVVPLCLFQHPHVRALLRSFLRSI
ncbi:trace amine-associated receptor 13c [Biomphalaria pfeifferi]|uniref:Trace amine-associated receptor 13c n=1 Tax=Biomphalaria pfeifferi TaxID=112525 RepID=A0AAD8C5Q3_BIOPF|nr:trace amine-associated receptor 13c [Biomphalaria pfeifferi]